MVWLRLRVSLLEAYEDGAHVVHTVLTAIVLGDKFIQQLLEDLLVGLTVANALVDPLNHLSVALDLPDAVASHNNKV